MFAAVDLGASSGRVVAGVVDGDTIGLDVVHRFPNAPSSVDGHLRWDLTGLYGEVLSGLSMLSGRYPQVESIGIDTWGVDYGMLDANGNLLGEPIAYRDLNWLDERWRYSSASAWERMGPRPPTRRCNRGRCARRKRAYDDMPHGSPATTPC